MIVNKHTKFSPSHIKIHEKQIKNIASSNSARRTVETPTPAVASHDPTLVICNDKLTPKFNSTTFTNNSCTTTTAIGSAEHSSIVPSSRSVDKITSESRNTNEPASALLAKCATNGSPSSSKVTNAATLTCSLATSTKIKQRQQQFLAAAAKSATSPQQNNQKTPSKGNVLDKAARYTITSSLATSMNTMNGVSKSICDRVSDRTRSEKLNYHERCEPKQQQPKSASGCERIAPVALDAAADVDRDGGRGGLISGAAGVARACESNSETAVAVISGCDGDISQEGSARESSFGTDNGCAQQQLSNDHKHHLHHHQQYHHQQQHQLSEVRRSGDYKEAIDDNNKNINRHNNHKSYPHNNQNFHQHNYSLFQYQQAQASAASLGKQNQTAQPQQQHIMAHYKFHNDCQSSVLTFEQVKRLDFVMDQIVPIHGRGSAPTLFVKLKELIRLVKFKLQNEHSIEIRDVILNGGAASYVLAPENSHYNDLDLVFGTDLNNEDRFDVIRDVVLECLMEFYPKEDHIQDQQHQIRGQTDDGEHSSEFSAGDIPSGSYCDVGTSDDDVDSEQSSRSNRSSSFESDNINVTTHELDDESEEDKERDEEDGDDGNGDQDDDDSEDDIIVRIDSDDTRGNGANTNELDSVYSRPTRNDPHAHTQMGGASKNIRTIDNHTKSQADERNAQQQTPRYTQMPPINCTTKEAYVHKMVKVNDDDRWSLISLGVQQSETMNYNHLNQCVSSDYSKAINLINARPVTDGRLTDGDNLVCCEKLTISSTSLMRTQHKQFPNSIELKFVDRMRRKFEFSVDSFQIILDSLIQFYDYAPQSTITIQKKLPESTSSMAFNNSNPHVCEHLCAQWIKQRQVLSNNVNDKQDGSSQIHSRHSGFNSETQVISNFLDNENKHIKQQKTSKAVLSGSASYYELSLDPGSSLSNSSVASSSGCSSSSSVVSSSSSSLSCDEDQEDLYNDVDNASSSAASTSSLMISATPSMSSSVVRNVGDRVQHVAKQVSVTTTVNSVDRGINLNSKLEKRFKQVPDNLNDCVRCCDKGMQLNQKHRSQSSATELLENRRFSMKSELSSCAVISENFYPTVIGRSEYGNFKEALYHLEKKLITTRSPEEIRGGGLLKYCNLLVKNYKPVNVYQIRILERYMCSRFFIDFSDLNQQRAKLESYLANHFSDDTMQKFDYLTILHNVVQRSTVCLMNHELRLTLNMIRELAYELNEQQRQQGPSPPLHLQLAPHQLTSYNQPTRQQDQYQQQKPVMLQSGVYRVKLVNHVLAKPTDS